MPMVFINASRGFRSLAISGKKRKYLSCREYKAKGVATLRKDEHRDSWRYLLKLLDILECNLEGEGGGYLQSLCAQTRFPLTTVRYHP